MPVFDWLRTNLHTEAADAFKNILAEIGHTFINGET